MFNLVADALAVIIAKAQERGLIKGVVSHLIPGGVSLLQYADDTVLMIECEENYILNLKFLLYCFECMSGFKINYHKSVVFVLGVDDMEAIRVSNNFNCKLGQLPLTYLGIDIGDRQLTKKAAGKIMSKLDKRLDNWKNNLLSLGGQLILTNSCLSSLPHLYNGVL